MVSMHMRHLKNPFITATNGCQLNLGIDDRWCSHVLDLLFVRYQALLATKAWLASLRSVDTHHKMLHKFISLLMLCSRVSDLRSVIL